METGRGRDKHQSRSNRNILTQKRGRVSYRNVKVGEDTSNASVKEMRV